MTKAKGRHITSKQSFSMILPTLLIGWVTYYWNWDWRSISNYY